VRITAVRAPLQKTQVSWQSIRLELDRTEGFPRGSASRAYLLRLPLLSDGAIDEKALAETPERATMRRMWPNEPDCSGHVCRFNYGWACVSGLDGCECPVVSEFQAQPIREGSLIMLTERGGRQLPFRIAKLRPLTHSI
jgi:hypothetical protein